MTPKELLDTMLGYLGFVVQIEETQSEGGNLTLQIYTEESTRLIGHDGETLEAIQFLLNRLLQAKDRDAAKVIVDCEMYRSMREDKIVHRVRELAERVRISGRSLAARADEFLRAPHRAQRLQGRSGRGDLEPIGFSADQTDHAPEAPAEKRARREGITSGALDCPCFAAALKADPHSAGHAMLIVILSPHLAVVVKEREDRGRPLDAHARTDYRAVFAATGTAHREAAIGNARE